MEYIEFIKGSLDSVNNLVEFKFDI